MDSKGRKFRILSDEVEGVYVFAGKEGRSDLNVRDYLQKQYKGTRAKDWAHVSGNIQVDIKGKPAYIQIHWFQHPKVGICKVKISKRLD